MCVTIDIDSVQYVTYNNIINTININNNYIFYNLITCNTAVRIGVTVVLIPNIINNTNYVRIILIIFYQEPFIYK